MPYPLEARPRRRPVTTVIAMDVIAIHAASKPAETALIEGERSLTWAEFAERRNRLAHGLQSLGVEAGQRVVMWAPNSVEYLLGVAAVAAIGCVSVPMN